MENSLIKRSYVRQRRALRVRKKVKGTSDKPRLSVIKTNKHIHVQLIDDENGHTIASTSTISPQFRSTEFGKKNKVTGKELGSAIGKVAKEQKIEKIVFDRGRFKYHGVIAAVAEGAREQGLKF